jgi:hypothetical protein
MSKILNGILRNLRELIMMLRLIDKEGQSKII